MAVTIKHETKTLGERRRHGRAVNAVADMLRNRLSVPNIYLEPRSSLIKADVLAVDRAGSGDLHAVEIKFPHFSTMKTESITRSRESGVEMRQTSELLERLKEQPAHFKYLAMPLGVAKLLFRSFDLFSPDGIGRIGIIGITEHDEQPPSAELFSFPERFRVPADRLEIINKKLLAKTHPDIEVRI
jgi:hypothetical protein